MKPIIRILLVEDHLIARIGITSIINMQPDMVVAAEAKNGAQGVESYRRHLPDITLMDLRMNEINGSEALRIIRSEFPDAKIIILSSHSGDAEIARVLRLGANGYVLKDVLEDELINAVRVVHNGKKYIPTNVAQILSEYLGNETLTPSEQRIVEMIVAGSNNKMIADQLFISENTVKSHLKNIFGKLGVNDRAQVVSVAVKRGFVSLYD
jgi:DNA-binding NarL/FixJ family response regulator